VGAGLLMSGSVHAWDQLRKCKRGGWGDRNHSNKKDDFPSSNSLEVKLAKGGGRRYKSLQYVPQTEMGFL